MSSSESLTQNVEAEDTSDGRTDENPDQNEEIDDTQNYRIRPSLEDKFKPLSAKEIIHNVLYDSLSSKEYNLENAKKWSKEISIVILNKIKAFKLKNYKYVCDVIIGAKNGAGVKSCARCIWDAEADTLAYDNFTNDSLFCLATVYAIYTY